VSQLLLLLLLLLLLWEEELREELQCSRVSSGKVAPASLQAADYQTPCSFHF
jgi:hypothetical protein